MVVCLVDHRLGAVRTCINVLVSALLTYMMLPGLWAALVVALVYPFVPLSKYSDIHITSRILPPVVRGSVGVVFPRAKQVIDWLRILYRYHGPFQLQTFSS